MTNVETTVKDGKLIITVDLKQDHGPSSTGKTNTVGTTHGFKKLEGYEGISFSVNVNRKVQR
jgi:hypothetical protein